MNDAEHNLSDYGIYIALVLLVVIWGSNFALIKLALDEFSVLTFTLFRYSVASVLVLSFLFFREGWRKIDLPDLFQIVLLGLLGHTVYQLAFMKGLSLTTAGNSSIFIATVPIWSAVLSSLFGKDRLSRTAWFGIIFAFSGSLLVIFGSTQRVALNGSHDLGNLLVLLAAILLSIYTVFSRDLLEKYSPLRFTALTMTAGLVGLWIFGGPTVLREGWNAISWHGWGILLYSAVLAMALGYVVWFFGIKKIGPARTAIFDNLTPVVAFLVAFILLGEQIVWLQVAGGAAVISGVYLTLRH
ncbi:MAG: DMT family transporter [Candidatus Bipolaricaulota bacterium]